MIIAGVTIIGLTVAVELGWIVALLMHKVRPTNPYTSTAVALFSGVAFAIGGLLLYLAA